MMRTLFLFTIYVLKYGDCGDIYCCSETQGFLEFETDSCVDSNNVSSAINLACSQSSQIAIPRSDVSVSRDGGLEISFDGVRVRFEAGTYCVANETTTSTAADSLAVVVCADSENRIIADEVLAYCMLVSAVFLALTALVYSVLPEISDVLGKSITNLCVALGLGLGILFIMKTMPYSDMTLCAMRGFLVYFFMLAAFFWMNAISIQILANVRRHVVPDYGYRQFGWYALYAWGCPALLTLGMAIVNYYPGDHQKPGIGLSHCWFFDTWQQWRYMYSVMTLLIVINTAIFVYASVHVNRISFSSAKKIALKYKFGMCVRLFVVMGLPWVFEMISSVAPRHIVWELLDVLNTIQGPLIFLLLVVFRRRVVKALNRRGYLTCISGLVERYLAVGDDEEDIVQDTTDIPLNQ